MNHPPRTRGDKGRGGPSSVTLTVVALFGVAAGLAAAAALIWGGRSADGGPAFLAIALMIGWSFIGTGLLAWHRRPQNRVGVLMVAIGFAWFLNGFTALDSDLFALGYLLGSVWIVLLFQLLLTFPSGRLETNAERILAAGAWTSGVVMQLPVLVFLRTPGDQCPNCPANALLIADKPGLAASLFAVEAFIGVVSLVGLLVLLVRRWRRSTPAQRGAFIPVIWSGGILMALIAALLATQALNAPEEITDSVFVLALIPFASVPFAFLLGVLRTQISRESAVGALIGRLGTDPADSRDLRAALADALGDPTLELAYWLPRSGSYVDAAGRPVRLPDSDSRDRVVTIVEHGDRPVAAMVHDSALAEQPELVRTVGAAAALALENERLEAELRARVEELRSSRARIVEAADSERRRLERDLHDGAQQRLVSLSLKLRLARSKAVEGSETAELLEEAMDELGQATAELRELARGIHPAVLSDRGLRAALDALAGRAPLPVEVERVPRERLPAAVESAAYFVVAEALTNVARYSQASRADVDIAARDGVLRVEIRDDGVGGADPTRGSGLNGLADRVSALDGTLTVVSPAGEGTTVTAELPCGAEVVA